jgi:hypothetical protein
MDRKETACGLPIFVSCVSKSDYSIKGQRESLFPGGNEAGRKKNCKIRNNILSLLELLLDFIAKKFLKIDEISLAFFACYAMIRM